MKTKMCIVATVAAVMMVALLPGCRTQRSGRALGPSLYVALLWDGLEVRRSYHYESSVVDPARDKEFLSSVAGQEGNVLEVSAADPSMPLNAALREIASLRRWWTGVMIVRITTVAAERGTIEQVSLVLEDKTDVRESLHRKIDDMWQQQVVMPPGVP